MLTNSLVKLVTRMHVISNVTIQQNAHVNIIHSLYEPVGKHYTTTLIVLYNDSEE